MQHWYGDYHFEKDESSVKWQMSMVSTRTWDLYGHEDKKRRMTDVTTVRTAIKT